MIGFAGAKDTDRRVLFSNAAMKLGLHTEVVEKDFWVCYTLDYLFQRSPWRKALVFKGGTSLSKVYHAIHRFSEDIDLILDWRLLDYGEKEPWEERSRTGQDKFNKKMVRETSSFLKDVFVPTLQKAISSELGREAVISMDEGDADQCTVNFYYPHVFVDSYLRPEIRLEIGPLAEWTPSHIGELHSFASEAYPEVFKTPQTEVLTVDIERTFWEKATILHKVACSSKEGKIPPRYSRHYYDLFSLSSINKVKENAFERSDLLASDIRFKDKFYHSKSASYETATRSTIRLIPDEEAIVSLRKDYTHMERMMYGNGKQPTFDEIISGLRLLEDEIHLL